LFKEASEAGAKTLISVYGMTVKLILSARLKTTSEAQKQELLSRTKAKAGHLLLFAAGSIDMVNKTLDRLRQVISRELGLIDPEKLTCWTDFPCLSGMPMRSD